MDIIKINKSLGLYWAQYLEQVIYTTGSLVKLEIIG